MLISFSYSVCKQVASIAATANLKLKKNLTFLLEFSLSSAYFTALDCPDRANILNTPIKPETAFAPYGCRRPFPCPVLLPSGAEIHSHKQICPPFKWRQKKNQPGCHRTHKEHINNAYRNSVRVCERQGRFKGNPQRVKNWQTHWETHRCVISIRYMITEVKQKRMQRKVQLPLIRQNPSFWKQKKKQMRCAHF